MQLVDIGGANLYWGCTTARKCRRQVLYRGPFPRPDLRGMHSELLGQFRQRHLLADRFKRNLGLKLPLSSILRIDCRAMGRMVIAFLHFGSSLSTYDPP